MLQHSASLARPWAGCAGDALTSPGALWGLPGRPAWRGRCRVLAPRGSLHLLCCQSPSAVCRTVSAMRGRDASLPSLPPLQQAVVLWSCSGQCEDFFSHVSFFWGGPLFAGDPTCPTTGLSPLLTACVSGVPLLLSMTQDGQVTIKASPQFTLGLTLGELWDFTSYRTVSLPKTPALLLYPSCLPKAPTTTALRADVCWRGKTHTTKLTVSTV